MSKIFKIFAENLSWVFDNKIKILDYFYCGRAKITYIS